MYSPSKERVVDAKKALKREPFLLISTQYLTLF